MPPQEVGLSIIGSFQTSTWQFREVTQVAQASSVPKLIPTPFCLTSNVDPGHFHVAILLAHGQGRQGPAGCGDLTWAFSSFGCVPWESQPVSTLLPASALALWSSQLSIGFCKWDACHNPSGGQ